MWGCYNGGQVLCELDRNIIVSEFNQQGYIITPLIIIHSHCLLLGNHNYESMWRWEKCVISGVYTNVLFSLVHASLAPYSQTGACILCLNSFISLKLILFHYNYNYTKSVIGTNCCIGGPIESSSVPCSLVKVPTAWEQNVPAACLSRAF